MKGRERDGIVEPGDQREALLTELKDRLEAVTDTNGKRIIRGVYRSDQIYSGNATALAPDLIIGYRRGYRGIMGDRSGRSDRGRVLLDNDSAWSADHCADALEVPGVLFCNRSYRWQFAVSGRHRPFDPGRIRAAHAASDGRQETLFRLSVSCGEGGTIVVKVKIETGLFDRSRQVAVAAGYSSVEEFVANCLEKEIRRLELEVKEQEEQVSDHLRGLGYIE